MSGGICCLLVGKACALSYPTQIQRNIRDAFKASVFSFSSRLSDSKVWHFLSMLQQLLPTHPPPLPPPPAPLVLRACQSVTGLGKSSLFQFCPPPLHAQSLVHFPHSHSCQILMCGYICLDYISSFEKLKHFCMYAFGVHIFT